jgi:hypothetical protein
VATKWWLLEDVLETHPLKNCIPLVNFISTSSPRTFSVTPMLYAMKGVREIVHAGMNRQVCM